MVRATQCRVRHRIEAFAAPRPTPLLRVAGVVEIAPQAPQIGADAPGLGEQAARRHRVAHDHGFAGAHDAGLLDRDGFAVRPQVFGMIDVDAGDDGAVRIEGIDRIEPPAHADLEDHEIEFGHREHPGDGQQRELKIGQAHVAARLLHRLEMRQQRAALHHLTVDPAALLEVHQVRLRIQPDAVARLQRNRLQHGAGRPLPVGAGHRDQRSLEVQAQTFLDAAHALERHVDLLRVQALAACQPAVQGRGQVGGVRGHGHEGYGHARRPLPGQCVKVNAPRGVSGNSVATRSGPHAWAAPARAHRAQTTASAL